MIDGIEIAPKPDRPRDSSTDERGQTTLFDFEIPTFREHTKSDDRRNEVTEERLFKDGQIPRHTNEKAHERKTESREEYVDDPHTPTRFFMISIRALVAHWQIQHISIILQNFPFYNNFKGDFAIKNDFFV
jgi:hypothetical protein